MNTRIRLAVVLLSVFSTLGSAAAQSIANPACAPKEVHTSAATSDWDSGGSASVEMAAWRALYERASADCRDRTGSSQHTQVDYSVSRRWRLVVVYTYVDILGNVRTVYRREYSARVTRSYTCNEEPRRCRCDTPEYSVSVDEVSADSREGLGAALVHALTAASRRVCQSYRGSPLLLVVEQSRSRRQDIEGSVTFTAGGTAQFVCIREYSFCNSYDPDAPSSYDLEREIVSVARRGIEQFARNESRKRSRSAAYALCNRSYGDVSMEKTVDRLDDGRYEVRRTHTVLCD